MHVFDIRSASMNKFTHKGFYNNHLQLLPLLGDGAKYHCVWFYKKLVFNEGNLLVIIN